MIRTSRRTIVALALAALCASTLWGATPARADELTIGVFLPQASFATNAERSAWAERFATDLSAKANGAFTIRAQVFARREDAVAFAGRVDLLVTDGLFALERGGEAIGHATVGPQVGLYAADAKRVGELAGKVVACAECGPTEALFYANTALGGELAASGFFSEIKSLKDSSAALAAVKSRQVAAAFAPVGHPAAAGLELVAQGGEYPIAVVVVVQKARLDPVRAAFIQALIAAPAGLLGGFVEGAGDAYAKARDARAQPRVLTAPAFVTGGAEMKPVAPPIRLTTRGKVGPPQLGGTPLGRPTLTEPGEP